MGCDATLAVKGSDRVWATGDCAQVPMPGGEPCAPTAQHAIRQEKEAERAESAKALESERAGIIWKLASPTLPAANSN